MPEANISHRGVRAFLAVLLLAASVAGPAHAADAMSTTMVTVSSPPPGALAPGPSGEQVVFSGQAKVKSRLVPDPEFGHPQLLLFIDMGSVAGLGASSGARYVTASQEILARPLAATHQIELTFPFAGKMTDPLSATRTGVVTLLLSVDVATGSIVAASANAVGR
jgi:hypothetical protein